MATKETKVKKVKLENYKGEMVCAVSKYKDAEYFFTDEVDEIKDFKKNGYFIHGTICEKVFDEYFIKNCLRDLFETYADDNGYDEMNEFMDYEGENYKKMEDAVRKYIKGLGTVNDIYSCDESVIIEVED